MGGFIIFDDFGDLYREEMIEGLEQAPSAFVGLLRGEAFGKRVIRVA